MFPFYDAVEASLNVDDNDSATVSWSSFRTDPENVPVSQEYYLNNSGNVSNTNTLTRFYADLVMSTYLTEKVDYFESSHHQESVGLNIIPPPTSPNYNIIYKRRSELNNFDNVEVYTPIDTVGTNTGTVNSNVPMYVAIRGTSTLYDVYRDISVVLDYGTTHILGSSYQSELTNLYNTIKPIVDVEQRPVYFVGHSLGAKYALDLLHTFHIQESPNYDHIETQFKCIMFAPLILVDDSVSYFRTSALQQYAKDNIEIHTIRGDFLSPLLINAGLGTVNSYENNVAPVVDLTDFVLGTWLVQATGSLSRDSYLNDDNHKLITFGGNTNGLESYKLINSLPDTTISQSLETMTNQYVKLDGATDTTLQQVYLWDNVENLNQDIGFVDYPHNSSTHNSHSLDRYNWTINRLNTPSTREHGIISTVDGVKYINFRRSLISEVGSLTSLTRLRYIVKATADKWFLMLTPTQVYVLPSTVETLYDEALQINTNNISVYYDTATPVGEKNRHLWSLNDTLVHASFVSNRRITFTAPPVITYTGFRASMSNPSSSTHYIRITDHYSRKVIVLDEHNSKYTVDSTSIWVGQYGIDWNNNTSTNAEDIWKVDWIGDSSTDCYITASQEQGSIIPNYIGRYHGTNADQYFDTNNPQIRIDAVSGSSKWTMKLIGIHTAGLTGATFTVPRNYRAFAWQSSGSNAAGYGYFDFEDIAYNYGELQNDNQTYFTLTEV